MTLQTACQRVMTPEDEVTAGLVIDGEPFTLSVRDGAVDVHVGAPDAPDVVLMTALEPMMAVADGVITREEFGAEHVTLTADDPAQSRSAHEPACAGNGPPRGRQVTAGGVGPGGDMWP